jgi:hypothetical protein
MFHYPISVKVILKINSMANRDHRPIQKNPAFGRVFNYSFVSLFKSTWQPGPFSELLDVADGG